MTTFIKISFSFLKVIVVIGFVSISVGCNEDPSVEKLESYSFHNYPNNNPIAYAGEYLAEGLKVEVQNNLEPDEKSGFTIGFEVVTGGGVVDDLQVMTDEDGIASTGWKLGTESFLQHLKAQITDPTGKVLTTMDIQAYAIISDFWHEVDFRPFSFFADMEVDTVNNSTWILAQGGLYKRGVHFLDWVLQENTGQIQNPWQIEIDKDGIIYIGASNLELYKSTDNGESWVKLPTKIPTPDPYYNLSLWLTRDGELWAHSSGDEKWHAWRSKDGGISWEEINQDLYGAIFRMQNGWIFSMKATPQFTLIVSKDDGDTWSEVTTPDIPYFFHVTPDDNIILATIAGNVTLYKSSDKGQSFEEIHSVPVTFGTWPMGNYFQYMEDWYYLSVPGHGVLKTNNFESFETIFAQPNIRELFIDHTGSLVARGYQDKLNSRFYYINE